MRKILNLTQYHTTTEQERVGVYNLDKEHRWELEQLLIFNELPSISEVKRRAEKIANIALKEKRRDHATRTDLEEDILHSAMVGGAPYMYIAPYLFPHLEAALFKVGIRPLYTFSQRVVETFEVDGTIHKNYMYKHVGFVEAVE